MNIEIFNLPTRWELSCQFHATGMRCQRLLDKILGGPQSQSGFCGDNKYLWPLFGIKLLLFSRPDCSHTLR
jgi:hypothetical protein